MNEISVSCRLSANKGFLNHPTEAPSLRVTMEGNHLYSDVLDISGTGVTTISVPSSIAVLGWTYFRNLSDSEHIELSTQNGGSFGANVFAILFPGEFALYPASNGTVYASNISAYGTSGQLKVVVLER